MKASEIRQKYLEFFKQKGHTIIPSASLIPENDPSVLFTTAGMHPLVPFLLGEKHPSGKLLASVQKCIRTGDIDEVGDATHLTFFEMLGNWSLGSYWKEEAIKWSWEFLTDIKWLGLDPQKLAITVFAGDEDCPFDQESYDLWRSVGVSEERIVRLGKEDNWWPAGGKNPGPQGPDTEIFYWTSASQPPATFDSSDKNWVEIWNNVFMQYNRTTAGVYEPLVQKNVDTGMGLERTAAALQGKNSVYEIELFVPILDYLKSIAKDYNEQSGRIIADHIKAAVFIMSDDIGIFPSNLKQGYVVRKLIRRAVRHARKIGISLEIPLTSNLVEFIFEAYEEFYTEIGKNINKVKLALIREEDAFEKSLENGLRKLDEAIARRPKSDGTFWELQEEISDRLQNKELAFDLFQNHGFPLEMIIEEARLRGLNFDEEKLIKNFNEKLKEHQGISRTASVGMFKGGLADNSEQVVKYHTATHLLHQALKDVLGVHANQKGSNITAERLRFDFTHPEKMTPEQIKQVEEIVNRQIQADLSVHFEEMSVDEAKQKGAVGLFGEKYGDKVKVYFIGDYSKEICGGPHVEHTGTMGHFKIAKEEAVSAGVRRIKAILS
ncbi:MAG: alanine--tRNA ligase [Patescibacteria group bacterium]|jgi:alanyl-tRNA synthetase